MSDKASTPELNELHKLLAQKLAEKIRSGDYTAADLSVARQFLKDNGIEALNVPGSPVAGLQTAVTTNLPFPTTGMSH